jgi:hypothetical protein
MAINPTNSRLFVANFFRHLVGINTVDWVTAKFAVMPRQHPKILEWLGELTVTPDGQFLYVVNQNLNKVSGGRKRRCRIGSGQNLAPTPRPITRLGLHDFWACSC